MDDFYRSSIADQIVLMRIPLILTFTRLAHQNLRIEHTLLIGQRGNSDFSNLSHTNEEWYCIESRYLN